MDKVSLAHGGGGRLSREIVEKVFLPVFGGSASCMEDSAELAVSAGRIAFTTDSYVVTPLFFPGGDIGKVAVCGTVNDLAVKGAVPKWISAGFIIEEGLPFDTLREVAASMSDMAARAGVRIVTGDTKVVEKGKADGLFINTAGVGEIKEGISVSCGNIRAGDAVIISGALGAHGVAVMNARHRLGLQNSVRSDVAPLNGMISAMLSACPQIHAMRDLTRGGAASAISELAESSGVSVELDENSIPSGPEIEAACAVLGLDSLYMANEGRMVCFLPENSAGAVLAEMKKFECGAQAAICGRVISSGKSGVTLRTRIGGRRALRLMEGEPLPRIC